MKKYFGFAAMLIGILLLSSATSESRKKVKIKSPDGFAFVPMGSILVDTSVVSVQAFFISKYEVSNLQYRTFLADLKAQGDTSSYRIAMIDSTKWRSKNAYNDPYVELYFRHPAYDNYPVVNVSREGAELYCQWLTKKYELSNPGLKTQFRLPYREEWIMAASAGHHLADYPWGGPYLRCAKGGYLCNFKNYGAESIHYNPETEKYEIVPNGGLGVVGTVSDVADITAPVASYAPNDYGIYNMSGNVAEMVQQIGIAVGGSWNSTGYDVRIASTMNFTSPSPYVGFRPVITYLGAAQ